MILEDRTIKLGTEVAQPAITNWQI